MIDIEMVLPIAFNRTANTKIYSAHAIQINSIQPLFSPPFVAPFSIFLRSQCLRLPRHRHPIRNLRPYIRNDPQQIIHHFLPLLVTGGFDGFYLFLGVGVGVFFSFFVAGGVLLCGWVSVGLLVGWVDGAGLMGIGGICW